MKEADYIEINKNSWERVYLSATKYQEDFDILFADYKAVYPDARMKDFANDCIIHYQICKSNIKYLEDIRGICDTEALVLGMNIIDEIQIYINNDYYAKTKIRHSVNNGIDHLKRKRLYITFNVILDFLEQKKATPIKTKEKFKPAEYALYHWIKILLKQEPPFGFSIDDRYPRELIEKTAVKLYDFDTKPESFYRAFIKIKDLKSYNDFKHTFGFGFFERISKLSNFDKDVIKILTDINNNQIPD